MENKAISGMIGSREYPLKLSTNAVKEIKQRFSGVEKAINALESESTSVFERLELTVSLVSILATHGARAYNFDHPEEPPIPDLPEETAGTILTIADLNDITPKIYAAFNEGVGRTVFSMPDDDSEKN